MHFQLLLLVLEKNIIQISIQGFIQTVNFGINDDFIPKIFPSNKFHCVIKTKAKVRNQKKMVQVMVVEVFGEYLANED